MTEEYVPIKKEELLRFVDLLPATDATAMGGGISSVCLRLWVKGSKGVVSVIFHTLWYLDKDDNDENCEGLGSWDIHAYKQDASNSLTKVTSCSYLDNKDCYCSGSSLIVRDLYWPLLLAKGSNGVLDALEKDYFNILSRGE